MLETLTRLLHDFRTDYAGFGTRKLTTLINLLARCGMTPSDRSRVMVERGDQEKPVTGLAPFRR